VPCKPSACRDYWALKITLILTIPLFYQAAFVSPSQVNVPTNCCSFWQIGMWLSPHFLVMKSYTILIFVGQNLDCVVKSPFCGGQSLPWPGKTRIVASLAAASERSAAASPGTGAVAAAPVPATEAARSEGRRWRWEAWHLG
jgi:hypothetical protein